MSFTYHHTILTVLVLFLHTPIEAQWTMVPSPALFVCDFSMQGLDLYAATSSGVFLSDDHGLTWKSFRTPPPPSGFTTMINKVDSIWFVSTNRLYRSKGDAWIQCTLPTGASSMLMLDSILFASTHGYGIHRSTDNGQTWAQSSSGLTEMNVWCLGDVHDVLFAGTYGGGVFRSTDRGNTWQPANIGITGLYSRFVNKFMSIDSILFVGTSTGVFRSMDLGLSWSSCNDEIINTWVHDFAYQYPYLFAGTNGGVFVSTNLGKSWRAFNTNLINYIIDRMVLAGPYLVIVTPAENQIDKLWRRYLSDVTYVTTPSHSSDSNTRLEQNYPNPFNSSTVISFNLACSGHTTLKIFNVLGECITTIVSQQLEPGTHSVVWHADGIPSGVYYYQLHLGDSIDQRKLLLLR